VNNAVTAALLRMCAVVVVQCGDELGDRDCTAQLGGVVDSVHSVHVSDHNGGAELCKHLLRAGTGPKCSIKSCSGVCAATQVRHQSGR